MIDNVHILSKEPKNQYTTQLDVIAQKKKSREPPCEILPILKLNVFLFSP